MMKLCFALFMCVALCNGQGNTEVTVEMMGECSRFCRATSRCPSVTSIIFTVSRLASECRSCIIGECGRVGRRNRTEVAECMYDARLSCDNCTVSNSSLSVRQECANCMRSCMEQIAAGNRPVAPTRRPGRRGFIIRPSRGGRVNPFIFGHRRRPFTGSSFLGSRNRCSCRSECSSVMAPDAQCRRCVTNQCRSAASRGVRGAFTACVRRARMSCQECGNRTAAINRRQRCAECINRCRNTRFPGGRQGGRQGMGGRGSMGGRTGFFGGRRPGRTLCQNNCVVPGFCPSTNAIISTINRSPQACRTCVRSSCGQMTNGTRDEVAACLFMERPNCSSCGSFGSAAMAQRQRCSSCRMRCEDMDMTTTPPQVEETTADISSGMGEVAPADNA